MPPVAPSILTQPQYTNTCTHPQHIGFRVILFYAFRILICYGLLCIASRTQARQLYRVDTGSIRFASEAPMELISASSRQLKGFVDFEQKVFAFKIRILSFTGFNSPLQQEHFHENYMETALFPEAVFSGKIIEDGDFTNNGTVVVRAKGKLNIHGMSQERIIKVWIKTTDTKIHITSDFTVLLQDHNIKIPRVVNNKLSPEIKVTVDAWLLPEKE